MRTVVCWQFLPLLQEIYLEKQCAIAFPAASYPGHTCCIMARNSGKSSQSGSGSSLPSAMSSSGSDSNLNINQQIQAGFTPQRFPPQQVPNQMGKPNAAKIESIKSYYYQLSASLRSITAQLQQPDLTPGRRQALGMQQEKLQSSLTEFTEKVLKPLMAAARSGTPPAHIDSGNLQYSSQQIPQQMSSQPFPHLNMSQQAQQHSQLKQYPTPQNLNRPTSRHLAMANQHFQDAQQQQMAFQQRLQARASMAAASNPNYFANYQQGNGSNSQSPHVQRPPPMMTSSSVSPSMTHLSRVTSLQRISSSQTDLQMSSVSVSTPDTTGVHDHEMILNTDHQGGKGRVKLTDLFPDWSIERQNKCLQTLDDLIDRIAEQSVQYAIHQGNEYLSERDVALAIEDVLGPAYRLPKYSYQQSNPTVVKRPTLSNNAHNNRLAQIKKDLALLGSKTRH